MREPLQSKEAHEACPEFENYDAAPFVCHPLHWWHHLVNTFNLLWFMCVENLAFIEEWWIEIELEGAFQELPSRVAALLSTCSGAVARGRRGPLAPRLRNSTFFSFSASTSTSFASSSIDSFMSMNLGSFIGSSHQTLNRMPHQRIRETGREPVASTSVASAGTPMEEVGYETNLDDLNLFARYESNYECVSEFSV